MKKKPWGANIQYLWLTERVLLTSSRIQTSVCVARPHAGTGASAHVLNHTTSPTKHTTPTQANYAKFAPTPKNTPHNPIKTTRATGISILQVNINGITNKQEELKQLVYTTQPDIITIQETKLSVTHHHIQNTQNNKLHSHAQRQSSKVRRRTTHIH